MPFPMAGPALLPPRHLPSGFSLPLKVLANVAEEAINPQRTMLLGFGSAIAHSCYFMRTYFYQFNWRGGLGSDRL